MKISNLLKLFPVLAIMFMMNVPTALAGGTNRGDNTSAEPGDKATTTREVTDPAHERRKGTNNPSDANDKKMKGNKHDMDKGTTGSGTDAGTSGTGTGTDSSGGGY